MDQPQGGVCPEIELMVGRCLNAWTRVEGSLRNLFLVLNGQNETQLDCPLGAAFDSIQSFEVRLTMLNALIRADPNTDRDNGAFRRAWHALYGNLSRNKRRRAEVAHFAIVTFITGNTGERRYELHPFFTLSSLRTGTKRGLTDKMLCAREAAFNTARDRLVRLQQYIRVTRDNALIGGQPVADPLRLLEIPTGRKPKGSAFPTQS